MRDTFYGIRIRASQPLPGFGDITRTHDPELEVAVEGPVSHFPAPQGTLRYRSSEWEQGRPALEVLVTADGIRFVYADGVSYLVAADGTRMAFSWPPRLGLADAMCYFGPVLGFVLRLRGVLALHAGAVVVGGSAVAIAGQAGAGKSTTIACLGMAGLAVVADDLLALTEDDDRFLAAPGGRHIGIWPDASIALLGDRADVPRFVEGWDKRRLDLESANLQRAEEPTPLRVVYILDERSPDAPVVSITPASDRDRFLKLLVNTYSNHLLDSAMRAQEFTSLARLERSVAVRLVRAPHRPSAIQEVAATILADASALLA